MNYAVIYANLITKGKIRNSKQSKKFYTENHHIVPRCLGGSDSKSNQVRLTAEEHLLSHLLLVKIHPNNHSLIHTAAMMTGNRPGFKQNSTRAYGWAKRKHALLLTERVISEETRAKLKLAKQNVSLDTRKKISDSRTGIKFSDKHIKNLTNDGRKGRKHSDETKLKCSIASKGRVHSEETKAALRKPKSEETKNLMSVAKTGRIQSEETKRKISASIKQRNQENRNKNET